jgi:thioredoxin reductase (NADPH)
MTHPGTNHLTGAAAPGDDARPPAGAADVAVDIAVVGAGPCGIAAAAAARRAGLTSLLVDRGPLCDSLVRYPPYMSFFSTPEKLEIEGIPFVTAARNATRLEALTYYRRVTEYFQLPTRLYEEVLEVRGSKGDFRLLTRSAAGESGEVAARHVVIATGGFHGPNRLDVPGEDLPKVRHHYVEAHPYWNQDVVVVGGGNSAVEASLELFRVGARVTLVHFLPELDRGVKPWILPDIRNRIEKGEVAARWCHRVREIRPGSVLLQAEVGSAADAGTAAEGEAEGAVEEIPNDFVLALTGWKPDPRLLRRLGVPVDPETAVPAHAPETMETPVPGIFIAGVLSAGHDANRIFIENGRWHGRAIVEAVTNSR